MSPVALVTGGTRGIGRGIAEAFAAAGYVVEVCARRDVAGLPYRCTLVDVRDPDAVAAWVDGVVARHGRIDVVVNNAGGAPPADAATVSPRFHEAIVRLNLLAPLHVSQAVNRVMQAGGGGVILNVCSVSGLRPSPGTSAYGAAKAGLLHLTRCLAVEWAPKVRVCAVTPGLVATEQVALHYGSAEAQARVAATVPAGRLGTPGDVGAACVWLASDAASYCSGSNIVIDGGGERPAFLGAAEEGP